MFRHVLIIIAVFIVTACTTTPTPAPTLNPTQTATPTPPPTRTPPPVPTSRPGALELSRATDPSQQAYLSVVHAADAPIFDVYVERLAIATNLDFAQNTQPSGIVAGEYRLRVVPRGLRPDSDEILYETPIALEGGDSLVLVFTGTQDALAMSFFPQQLEPLDSGQARLTVIHAMPESPIVTVAQGETPLTSPLSFGTAALPVTLPAGETTLTFLQDSAPLVSYTGNLLERYSYTLVLTGKLDNPAVVELRNRVPGRANIRAVNAAGSIGPVDIYLGDQLLVNTLDFTRMSERQTAAAQVATIGVYEAGADRATSAPLLTDQLVANNDDFITLVLMGTAQDLRIVSYREDLSLTLPDEARVTFVNTLPQVSRVRIDTQSHVLTEVGDLGYAQPPRPVALTAGSWRFAWMGVENNQTSRLLELADNVQLEPGRSYLYLFTGRINEPPLILSDQIGIDETMISVDRNEFLEPTPLIPTHIRFVNAIKGSLPLDIVFNDQLLFSGLAYGNTSALVAINAGEHAIDINFGSAGETVASADVILEPSAPYTVIAFGFGTDPVRIMVIDDSDLVLAGNSPHFRLLNLTIGGEVEMGLAYSVITPSDAPASLFSESPQTDNFRRSLAFGIDRVAIITGIQGREASTYALAPLGLYDLHVIDTGRNLIAASVHKVDLVPGMHYDIIAYQNIGSMLVEGFVVRYPPS